MAIPFTQLVSSTFDDVVNEKNKAADQWSDSSFLKHLEKLGGVKRTSGGATLQLTLDYKANPAADFLATDVTPTSTSKTEILTAASYTYVPLVVPINWSIVDESLNSEKSQKVDMVASIVDNMLASHDQAIESALVAATGGTDGFNTLVDIYSENGEGTVGTIVSGTETWWKSKFKDYDAAAALLADMETLWMDCSKGSSGRQPNCIVTSQTGYGVYTGKLVANQRFIGGDTASGSFNNVKFHNADVIFTSAYTSDSYWFFHTKDTQLFVVKGAWRQQRPAQDHVNALMVNKKLYSICQLATRNRSRGGVLFT